MSNTARKEAKKSKRYAAYRSSRNIEVRGGTNRSLFRGFDVAALKRIKKQQEDGVKALEANNTAK